MKIYMDRGAIGGHGWPGSSGRPPDASGGLLVFQARSWPEGLGGGGKVASVVLLGIEGRLVGVGPWSLRGDLLVGAVACRVADHRVAC
jgi:hypothetical protein